MVLKRFSPLKSRHDDVNYALRTRGEAVLAEPRVISYLSRALHYKTGAEHEVRRAALLEALSVNLSQYVWITVNRSVYKRHLSLEFHLTRISSESPAIVPPHLGALITALARTTTPPAELPSVRIIDKDGHLHYAKAFSDGTYTYLPLDPSYDGEAAQAPSLQALIDSISAASDHPQKEATP